MKLQKEPPSHRRLSRASSNSWTTAENSISLRTSRYFGLARPPSLMWLQQQHSQTPGPDAGTLQPSPGLGAQGPWPLRKRPSPLRWLSAIFFPSSASSGTSTSLPPIPAYPTIATKVLPSVESTFSRSNSKETPSNHWRSTMSLPPNPDGSSPSPPASPAVPSKLPAPPSLVDSFRGREQTLPESPVIGTFGLSNGYMGGGGHGNPGPGTAAATAGVRRHHAHPASSSSTHSSSWSKDTFKSNASGNSTAYTSTNTATTSSSSPNVTATTSISSNLPDTLDSGCNKFDLDFPPSAPLDLEFATHNTAGRESRSMSRSSLSIVTSAATGDEPRARASARRTSTAETVRQINHQQHNNSRNRSTERMSARYRSQSQSQQNQSHSFSRTSTMPTLEDDPSYGQTPSVADTVDAPRLGRFRDESSSSTPEYPAGHFRTRSKSSHALPKQRLRASKGSMMDLSSTAMLHDSQTSSIGRRRVTDGPVGAVPAANQQSDSWPTPQAAVVETSRPPSEFRPKMESRPTTGDMSVLMASSRGRMATDNSTSVGSHASTVPAGANKVRKRLFGRARAASQEASQTPNVPAWIITDEWATEYNTSPLRNGEIVSELWKDERNVYVHVLPRESSQGPSFKMRTTVLGSSGIFRRQMREQLPSSNDPKDMPKEYHVYVPFAGVGLPDLERLITIRNLFAFLTFEGLVATKAQPTLFKVLYNVSQLLGELEFSSSDGETWGKVADRAFGWILSQTPSLSDVRFSCEKTLEALVLGEKMRSKELYHEAYAHAIGKYDSVIQLRSPTFNLLSLTTQNRLERSHFDLLSKQDTINLKLEQFDFPALFAGIASSNSANKEVDFPRWKTSFGRMRGFILSYYRSTIGSWPPKANSKKHNFSEGGLSRLALKLLYTDLCMLYDLMVDRKSLSPRIGGEQLIEPDRTNPHGVISYYLRKILDEYDTSTPPVVPPVPFDIPIIPSMTTINPKYDNMSHKEQLSFDRKLHQAELHTMLGHAYNKDTAGTKHPIITQFKEFEAKEARGLAGGKPIGEITDQRLGYWLFLYAVIQALPILVIDSPHVQHSGGCEYFLCQPPMGPLPWTEDSGRKMWFEIAGGGVVKLPPEAVKYSVQATYHRSHCWQAAKEWEAALVAVPTLETIDTDTSQVATVAGALTGAAGAHNSPLEPPTTGSIGGDGESVDTKEGASPVISPMTASTSPLGSPQMPRPRNMSPASRTRMLQPGGPGGHYRSSVALGIEPLAMPEDKARKHFSMALTPGSSTSSLTTASLSEIPRSNLAVESGSGKNKRYSFFPPGHEEEHQEDSTQHTFDEILGRVEKKQTKSKKWGIF